MTFKCNFIEIKGKIVTTELLITFLFQNILYMFFILLFFLYFIIFFRK